MTRSIITAALVLTISTQAGQGEELGIWKYESSIIQGRFYKPGSFYETTYPIAAHQAAVKIKTPKGERIARLSCHRDNLHVGFALQYPAEEEEVKGPFKPEGRTTGRTVDAIIRIREETHKMKMFKTPEYWKGTEGYTPGGQFILWNKPIDFYKDHTNEWIKGKRTTETFIQDIRKGSELKVFTLGGPALTFPLKNSDQAIRKMAPHCKMPWQWDY